MSFSDEDEVIKNAVARSGDAIRVPAADAADALRRAKRYRARRFVSGLAVAAICLGVIVGVALRSGDKSPPERSTGVVAGQVREAAPVYAALALEQAGLLDVSGEYMNFAGIEEQGDVWAVKFEPMRCRSTAAGEGCVATQDPLVTLEVALEGEAVRFDDVRGLAFDQEERVRSYGSRPVVSLHRNAPPFSLFPGAKVHGIDRAHIEATVVWTGPIPAAPNQVELCAAHLLDPAGKVAWSSEPVEMRPPSAGEPRIAGLVGWNDIPSSFRTLEDVRITCSSEASGAWNVESTSNLRPLDDGSVATTADISWDGPIHRTALYQCVGRLMTSSSEVLGTDSHVIPAPVGERSRTQELAFVFANSGVEDSTIDIECSQVTAAEVDRS